MIYLDSAATTQLAPEVRDWLVSHLETDFANPASAHGLGLEAEKQQYAAMASLAHDLGCSVNELIVTSGATESANTAIFSAAAKRRHTARHMVCGIGDHDATLASTKRLQADGWEVSYVDILPNGAGDLEDLERKQKPDTQLICLLMVNNELGGITDVLAVRRLRDRICPDALIYVDMVQAWTRMPINLHDLGCDYASFAGHKIRAPKGIGLLYVRHDAPFVPLIVGGGQQKGRRSGTENPLLIAALALASRLGTERTDTNLDRIRELNGQLREQLADLEPRWHSDDHSTPYILNFSLPGVRGETLLNVLSSREIYVSTGSACSSSAQSGSHVLRALRLPPDEADSTLRISLDPHLTAEDMDRVSEAIHDAHRLLKF